VNIGCGSWLVGRLIDVGQMWRWYWAVPGKQLWLLAGQQLGLWQLRNISISHVWLLYVVFMAQALMMYSQQ
jgi:hypothetical protein